MEPVFPFRSRRARRVRWRLRSARSANDHRFARQLRPALLGPRALHGRSDRARGGVRVRRIDHVHPRCQGRAGSREELGRHPRRRPIHLSPQGRRHIHRWNAAHGAERRRQLASRARSRDQGWSCRAPAADSWRQGVRRGHRQIDQRALRAERQHGRRAAFGAARHLPEAARDARRRDRSRTAGSQLRRAPGGNRAVATRRMEARRLSALREERQVLGRRAQGRFPSRPHHRRAEHLGGGVREPERGCAPHSRRRNPTMGGGRITPRPVDVGARAAARVRRDQRQPRSACATRACARRSTSRSTAT